MSERAQPAEGRSAERPSHDRSEIERAASERLRQLEHDRQRPEAQPDQVEAARERIARAERQEAQPRAEATPTEATPTAEPKPFHQVLTTAVNYRQTMVSLRHRLRPTSRSFSRFIHAPVVEKTSEVVGATVLRPSVSLGATTTAVLFTGFMYLFARHYGFLLRGSEIWLSLLAGGVIGLVIEAITKLIRRRRV